MAVTGQNLIDAAMDIGDFVNDPHVATATWLRWANRGIEKLWRRMVATHQLFAYLSSSFTLTTVANSVGIQAATARQILGVTKDPDNATLRKTLHRYNFEERDEQYELSFSVEGNSIVIRPKEYAPGTYRYYYATAPTPLAVVGDQIDNVYEPYIEFVETYMALKAKAKEESDTEDLKAELKEIWEEIEAVFMSRISAAGETITDVERTGGAWSALVRP